MPYGYNGKILRIDLSREEIAIEENDEYFYRTYIGGATLGAYYLLKEQKARVNPLSPENIIVFACSVVTGTPAPGFSRYAIVSKSPLTGAIGDTQAGGFWGPELKFAGYDAIVIKGIAREPVYLFIQDGEVKIRKAAHLWRKTTGEVEQIIRKEYSDPRIRVLSIGCAGENLVRFASVLSDCKHAAGRLGMGAVMGSKNLKAIAVRGHSKIEMKDEETVRKWSRWFSKNFMNNPVNSSLHNLGTGEILLGMNADGQLPTRNFQTGFFEGAEGISAETMHKTIFQKGEGCYACPVKCKRVVEAKEPYTVDPTYGGPEYETIAALGSNCGIDKIVAIAKANELCNKYGLDTISTGAVIAFAMECYEKGIIGKDDTGGISLKFGDAKAMLRMVEIIAKREGIGDILAEGSKRTAKKFGKGAEGFTVEVKGEELAMHDGRVKGMVGFAYAVSPVGADHVVVEHDTDFDFNAPDIFIEQMKSLGLLDRCKTSGMDHQKVRMFCYLQNHFSFMDSLCLCVFAFAPVRTFKMSHLVEIASAVTGWELSLWEIMKLGERRVNMFKAFNVREGFTIADDWLPPRMFEPIQSGSRKGSSFSEDELREMRELYYKMQNWDNEGRPTQAKLIELDLEWIANELAKTGEILI